MDWNGQSLTAPSPPLKKKQAILLFLQGIDILLHDNSKRGSSPISSIYTGWRAEARDLESGQVFYRETGISKAEVIVATSVSPRLFGVTSRVVRCPLSAIWMVARVRASFRRAIRTRRPPGSRTSNSGMGGGAAGHIHRVRPQAGEGGLSVEPMVQDRESEKDCGQEGRGRVVPILNRMRGIDGESAGGLGGETGWSRPARDPSPLAQDDVSTPLVFILYPNLIWVGRSPHLYYFRVVMEHSAGQTFSGFVAMNAEERRNWHFSHRRAGASAVVSPRETLPETPDRLSMRRSDSTEFPDQAAPLRQRTA